MSVIKLGYRTLRLSRAALRSQRHFTAAAMRLESAYSHIVASNRKLHRAMRERITKVWPEAVLREAEGRAAP